MIVLSSLFLSALALQDAPPRIPLRVLYVGNEGSERASSYRDFLAGHFRSVATMARDGFEPTQAEGYDVVLLDWSQQDVDLGHLATLRSPLGPRAQWTTPTVLLDSAGLLIAVEWRTTGSYG